jgi:transcriptional regulator with XRE-family HTH domain
MSIESIEKYRERSRLLERDPLFIAELLKLEFADDLVRLLEARGLKRTELAEKLGTNRGYVTRVLNTEYNLSVETMAKIALALDARISLRMLPREEVERRPRSSVPSRTARRREREHELASPLLAQNVASDKPARRKA